MAAPPNRLVPSTAHRRRLRDLWRSAGWPYQDPLEAELLAAGLLLRERDAEGRERVRVTEAGVALLANTLQRNRASRQPHEDLVERVAREMQRAGRVVWRGLSLRARVSGETPAPKAAEAIPPMPAALTGGNSGGGVVPGGLHQPVPMALWGAPDDPIPVGPNADDGGQWVLAMPDVFSIRHTTVESYLAPVAHEVKVRRADLLADLRRPAKGEAYRWLASECWYVIREGIAEPDEIPPVYGVLVAPPSGPLVVARPAPQRPMRLPFPVWMALARATPEPVEDDAQALLVDPGPSSSTVQRAAAPQSPDEHDL